MMNIGIIEAENIVSTSTGYLYKLGHRVSIANSGGPQLLVDLAEKTGAIVVKADNTTRAKDRIILAVPCKE